MPVFARKPIFAYRALVYCALTTTGLSLVVWAHHMFISGMDPKLATPFTVTTILISVPFAVIVFAMIATLWRGAIRFDTPMLFALGGLTSFLLGGLTGIFLGSPPPHENFERTPRVQRWPYEYSAPGAKLDWNPQAEEVGVIMPAAGL